MASTYKYLYIRRNGATTAIRLYSSQSKASLDGGTVLAVRTNEGTYYAACSATSSSYDVMRFRDSSGKTRYVRTHIHKAVLATYYKTAATYTLDSSLFQFGGYVNLYGGDGASGAAATRGTPGTGGVPGLGIKVTLSTGGSAQAYGGGGGGGGGSRSYRQYVAGASDKTIINYGTGGAGGLGSSTTLTIPANATKATITKTGDGEQGNAGVRISTTSYTPPIVGGAGGAAGDGTAGSAGGSVNGGAGGSAGSGTGIVNGSQASFFYYE